MTLIMGTCHQLLGGNTALDLECDFIHSVSFLLLTVINKILKIEFYIQCSNQRDRNFYISVELSISVLFSMSTGIER